MSSRSIVGLEIAERWVRGVELTRPASRKPTVRAVGEVSLPEGAARDSEVLDTDAVAVALSRLWSEAGFKSKEVVIGVGNRRVLVREYTAPNLPLDQVKKALRFQVQDQLPVPIDQAVLDFYPVEPTTLEDGSEGVSGLLVSAVAENIDGLLAAVNHAKLHAVGVELAPFGLARAAARVVQPGVRSLVAHIGAGTSSFVVLEDGIPRFVRIVPAGISVARVAEGQHRAPEGSLLDMGDSPAPAPEALPAEEAVSPFPGFVKPEPEPEADPVEEFLTWFTGTRDFYERAHAEKPLGQVLITGEGSLHPAIGDRLRSVSDVEVDTFGLADVFGADVAPTQDRAALTAAGVAIGGEV